MRQIVTRVLSVCWLTAVLLSVAGCWRGTPPNGTSSDDKTINGNGAEEAKPKPPPKLPDMSP